MESKRIVEALMLGGVLVVSMANQAANATTACSNGTATGITAGSFIKQAFAVKCSANVDVDYVDASGTLAVVKGMSRKGMHSFGGSTDGGSVKVCENSSIAYAAPAAGTTTGSNGCS